MRPKVNSNHFEISLRVSLRCKVTSLSAFRWLQAKSNSLRCKFHFGQIDWSETTDRSDFSIQTVNTRSEINLRRKLVASAHVRCYYQWKNNQYRNIRFVSMFWKVDAVKLPCKWNNFSKRFEISNRLEFTSDLT